MTKLIKGILITLLLMTGQLAFSSPALQIPDERFDFGILPQSSVVRHFFWFKSTGADTVVITDIKTGCSCSMMPLETNLIPPGDSMRVGVYWDTKKKVSKSGNYPYIFTNASPDPLQVFLTGNVITAPDSAYPISFSPFRFELSRHSKVSVDSISFRIQNRSDKEITLLPVSFPVEECEIKLPEKIQGKASVTGYIKVKPEYLDKEFTGSITLQLDDNQKTRVTVPIRRRLY